MASDLLAQEVNAARTGALVVAAPELGVIAVTGGDRKSWLNGLVTCDLAPLGTGAVAYGLAVAQKGRILADAVFLVGDDCMRAIFPKSEVDALRKAFEHYLIMEDAEIGPLDENLRVYAVHGPRSADVLAAATKLGAHGGAWNRLGPGGAIFVIGHDREAELRSALSDLATFAHGQEAWDVLRIHKGVPRFGVDFDTTMYPQEASLEKVAVSFSKGCYLGQEVVCMLEMRGHVKRKLVRLALDGAEIPARGVAVTDETGESVGEVMSAARAIDGEPPVAIAMVKYARATEGTKLRIGGANATVATIGVPA